MKWILVPAILLMANCSSGKREKAPQTPKQDPLATKQSSSSGDVSATSDGSGKSLATRLKEKRTAGTAKDVELKTLNYLEGNSKMTDREAILRAREDLGLSLSTSQRKALNEFKNGKPVLRDAEDESDSPVPSPYDKHDVEENEEIED